MSNLLQMKMRDLERVLYYEQYVVVDPGDTPLKEKQMLPEEQYHEAKDKYGSKFTAMMGAEAVRQLLINLNLEQLSADLHENIQGRKPTNTKKRLMKRLRIVENFIRSGNK